MAFGLQTVAQTEDYNNNADSDKHNPDKFFEGLNVSL